MMTHKTVIQLVRYGLVGIATNLTGYLVYLLVTYLGAKPKIAMSLLYSVGMAASYWGNRKFTFKNKGNVFRTSTRYLIAHFLGYLINLAMLIVMVDKLGYAHQWVQAAAIFVVAAYLFLAFKFFVFGQENSINTECE